MNSRFKIYENVTAKATKQLSENVKLLPGIKH